MSYSKGLKKSFMSSKTKNEQMELQITSMADIFVIILVFLLKSYSVEGLPYEPSIPSNPPIAKGRVEKTDALKVEVSKDAVNFGGKSVASIAGYRFEKKDIDSEGAFSKLRSALAKGFPEAIVGSKGAQLMIVVDEMAPYETVKTVLATAAAEGYQDIKLAVSHAQ